MLFHELNSFCCCRSTIRVFAVVAEDRQTIEGVREEKETMCNVTICADERLFGLCCDDYTTITARRRRRRGRGGRGEGGGRRGGLVGEGEGRGSGGGRGGGRGG